MSLRVTHIPQTFPRSVSLQPCAYLRWGTGSGRRKVSGCLAAIERDRTSGKYHLPKRLRRPRRRFPGAIPRSKDRAQFGTSAVIGPRSVMWTAQQPGGEIDQFTIVLASRVRSSLLQCNSRVSLLQKCLQPSASKHMANRSVQSIEAWHMTCSIIHPTARDGMNGESNLGHPERARDPKCDKTRK